MIAKKIQTCLLKSLCCVTLATLTVVYELRADDITVCSAECDYTTIQEAADASEPYADMIIVGEGRYHENLVLGHGITIQGAGANRTIIDGGRMDRVIYYFADLTISGVTITRGKIDDGCGGGIYGEAGSLEINDSIVCNNMAYSGGGLCNLEGSQFVTNTIVRKNEATENGGGIAMPMGFVELTHSIVSNNTAGQNGGGVITNYYGTIELNKSSVFCNRAHENGGGIHSSENSVVYVHNSHVSGNRARGNGGGIHSSQDSEVDIKNSRVNRNRASGNGGGIFNGTTCNLNLIDALVVRNRAHRDGGGVFNDGGTVSFSGTTFLGNLPNHCSGCP